MRRRALGWKGSFEEHRNKKQQETLLKKMGDPAQNYSSTVKVQTCSKIPRCFRPGGSGK
jgi:hypothetical protein